MKWRGNRKYALIILAIVAFLVLQTVLNQPQKQWIPTWSAYDKDALGGYVSHELMEDFYPGMRVKSEFHSLYELLGGEDPHYVQGSILVTNSQLSFGKEDLNALLAHVWEGYSVLLAAEEFYGPIVDSLGIETDQQYGSIPMNADAFVQSEEEYVSLAFGAEGYPTDSFKINLEASGFYFSPGDTTTRFTSLAQNEKGYDVLRSYEIGDGQLFVSSNPLLLTNYYMLDESSRGFSAGMLSLLPPDQTLTHVEYYTLGRMESQSPLRYLLDHPALKAALWLTLISIVLFMLFEARRKQRIIPIVQPPVNSSIEFVKTLGQLYFSSGNNHLNLATKRMNYFLEYVRRHYYIMTNELDDDFIRELSLKSGQEQEKVKRLVALLQRVRAGGISQEDFLRMELWLNRFYNKVDSTEQSQ